MKKHDILFFLILGLFLIELPIHALSLPTHQADDQAIRYYEQQLTLAQQKRLALSMEQAYRGLAEAYASKGDYKKAYTYERLRFSTHDSIVSISKNPSAAVGRTPTKSASPSSVSKIGAIKSWLWNTWALSSGLVILLLSLLLYRSYHRTRQINFLFHQQTDMLVAQRDSIEEKSQKME
jgi:hypothetical protein